MPPVDNRENSLTEFVPLTSSTSFNLFKRSGPKGNDKSDAHKLYLCGSFHQLIEPKDEEEQQQSNNENTTKNKQQISDKKSSRGKSRKKEKKLKSKNTNNINNNNTYSSSSSISTNSSKKTESHQTNTLNQIKYVTSTYDETDSESELSDDDEKQSSTSLSENNNNNSSKIINNHNNINNSNKFQRQTKPPNINLPLSGTLPNTRNRSDSNSSITQRVRKSLTQMNIMGLARNDDDDDEELSERTGSAYAKFKRSLRAGKTNDTGFWMPDNKVKKCYECGTPFSVFKRKHHCRICGQIFCWKCSQHFIEGEEVGMHGTIRVCNYCYEHSTPKSARNTEPQKLKFGFGSLFGDGSESSDCDDSEEASSDSNSSQNSEERHITMSPSLDAIQSAIKKKRPEDIETKEHIRQRSLDDELESDDDTSYGSIEGVRHIEPDDRVMRYNSSAEDLTIGEDQESESAENHRRSLETTANEHLRKIVHQLILYHELDSQWEDIVLKLALKAVKNIDPPNTGKMDIRHYIKIKKVPGHSISQCEYVDGLVCRKNVVHRKMKNFIPKPRILLVGCALEYERVENKFTSFDVLLDQEEPHLRLLCARICQYRPDVLFVQKNVSKRMQEMLLNENIALISNVKRDLMYRIARCVNAEILPTVDEVKDQSKVGTCEAFQIVRRSCSWGAKTLLYLRGGNSSLSCTLNLVSDDYDELLKIKDVAQFTVHAAYNLNLETSFFFNEFGTFISRKKQDKKQKSSDNDEAGESDDEEETEKEDQEEEEDCILSVSPYVNFGIPSQLLQDKETTKRKPTEDLSKDEATIHSPPFKNMRGFRNSRKREGTEEKKSNNNERLSINSSNHIKSSSSFTEFSQLFDAIGTSQDEGVTTEEDEEEQVQSPHTSGAENASLPQQHILSPYYHQNFIVLFNKVSNTSEKNRSHPGIIAISYYTENDMPLGKFLEQKCFNKNRLKEILSITRTYTHRDGRITVRVEKLPHPIIKNGDRIHMYNYSKQKQKILTPIVPMSDKSWKYSFGKFLETSFYNHALKSRIQTRDMQDISVHRDLVRCFCIGNLVARFEYEHVTVYNISFPPPTLQYNADYQRDIWRVHLRQLYETTTGVFFEVLNTVKEMERDESLAPKRSKIEQFREQIERQRKALLESMESLKMQEGIYQHNVVRRILYTYLLSWNSTLAELSSLKQPPSSHSTTTATTTTTTDSNTNKTPSPVTTHQPASLTSPPPPQKKAATSWAVIRESEEDAYQIDNSPAVPSYHHAPAEIPRTDSTSSDMTHRITSSPPDRAGLTLSEDVPSASLPSPSATSSASTPALSSLRNSQEQQQQQQHYQSNHPSSTVTADNYSSTAEHGEGRSARGGFSMFRNVIGKNAAAPLPDTPASHTNTHQQPYRVKIPESICNENMHYLGSSDDHMVIVYDDEPSTMIAFALTSRAYDDVVRQERSSSSTVSNVASYDTLSPEPVETPSPSPSPSASASASVSEIATATPGRTHSVSPAPPSSSSTISSSSSSSSTSNLYQQQSQRQSSPISPTPPSTTTPTTTTPPLPSSSSSSAAAAFVDNHDADNNDNATAPSTTSSSSVSSLNNTERNDESNTMEPSNRTPASPSVPPLSFTTDNNNKSSRKGKEQDDPSSIKSEPEKIRAKLLSKDPFHFKYNFDEKEKTKTQFYCTCYYAKQFSALRQLYCGGDESFMNSMARCKKWIPTGGKSGSTFTKTWDDRFILKQISRTELLSFLQCGPAYFEYMSKIFYYNLPSVLVKIVGVFRVAQRQGHSSRYVKRDMVVMENLFYNRNTTRTYDLKGSLRNRYQTDQDAVQLDENLLEFIYDGSPLITTETSKAMLSMSIWNDTLFLSKLNVMDYSLLVGVDDNNEELVVGIIDYIRQYTWDKQLETWVKSTGIMGGRRLIPTVVSPKHYKTRFREAMERYILLTPDKFTGMIV